MNTNDPSDQALPVDPGMNITTSGRETEPPVRLFRLLLSLALIVVIFDLCFWDIQSLDFSVAVFFPVLAGIILVNRESFQWRRTTRLMLALLIGATLATVVETGITNMLVLLMLIIALAGDTFFCAEQPWGRWLSQAIALTRAPGRIFWLGGVLLKAGFSEGLGWAGGFIGGCLLAVPALVLALIFGALLASGNAVFSSWSGSFFDWFWNALALCLDPGRIALWIFVAFLVLPLLRPADLSDWWWIWIERLPRLPEIVPTRASAWSSGLVLVVLNLLFFVANTADALFLWGGRELPSGVTYKAYVHQGVNSLIVTVILSAIVLTIIFQQALKVAQRRELKLLAYVWIVQNLFLLLNVAERLRRYIESFEMTVARLSVLIFLVLVSVGYILLTVKITRERSVSWLMGGCAWAVFATFYITQFMDLAGWSANYNAMRMEKDLGHRFDTKTMCQWGADVWPALRRVHDLVPADAQITEAWQQAQSGPDYANRSGLDWQHWREFSLRAWMNRGALEEKQNN